MDALYETFSSRDYRDDYEYMQSDRELQDMRDEERYRDSEVNFGLESEIYAIPAYVEPTPRCQCCLCTARVPELPSAIPAQSETRAARLAEVA